LNMSGVCLCCRNKSRIAQHLGPITVLHMFIHLVV
jgi:hypothetical protein